ncbi:hypothetical protein [Alishewanella sp. HH-ZS]|uniref:hypothetical protein n=1 Tax=Alishewanella sp. HH-ZS TaxID=1856684 RepID=UPI00082362B0|nr:hypothetical protein [Alishewanella sp. HH-ZS]OCW96092.1 hypothetical protein A9165_13390 [Alishewanella sp. HH-ZS]
MFERIQKETHIVEDRKLTASYDRFSTVFTLTLDDKILVSKRFVFTSKYESEIEVASKIYKVHVFAFILWRSKLTENNQVIIEELIPSRKRKSIGGLIYSLVVGAARVVG